MTRGSEIPGKTRNSASPREDTVVTTTRLHELREARGLGAAEIARHVGVSRQTIYAIEAGNYTPNTAVALQLARVLEVSVENLFSITADTSDRPLGNISADLLATAYDRYSAGELVRIGRVGSRMIAAPAPRFRPFYPKQTVLLWPKARRALQFAP
jgi:putative molybdopterin biosynthesis protein